MNTPLLEEYGLMDVPSIDEGVPQTPGCNAPVSPSHRLTEFEYANALSDSLPPIKTSGKVWRIYKEGAWEETDRARFRPAAQNILAANVRTERRAAALLDHLDGRAQVDPDSFIGFHKTSDKGEILINVDNGVVAVTQDDIKLLPHDPTYNYTARTAAAYNAGATAPLFERILEEALPDEADRHLYQIFAGNILLPDARFEVALVNYGESGRSKSTVAEPIANVLGSSLVTRLAMSQICDPKSYHVPKLRYAAVNLGTELDAIEMADSATFKALVSGEPVEARPIYGAPFTMQTTAKMLFLANSLPRFKHGTEAELRRMRFLRFDQLPAAKDNTLKCRLAAERDGIFLWMLQGLRLLLPLSEIPFGGQDSRAVHDRFRISNDPAGAFVRLLCRVDMSARVEKQKLKFAFEEFCNRFELNVACNDWFFKALYERWPNLSEVRPGSGSGRTRFIVGIALNP